MKGFYFCIFLSFINFAVYAQSNFRSNGTGGGDWNLMSTWEVETPNGSGTWIPALSTPSSGSNTIQIRAGDAVNVTANVTIDQTTVDAGAELNISSGINLAINAGTGDDLVVNGIINNNQGDLRLGGLSSRVVRVNGIYNNSLGNNTGASTSRLIFSEGSTYNHNFPNTSAGEVPPAGWHTNSDCIILASNDAAPAGLNQSFGNFVWNYSTQTAEIDLGGQPISVGSFSVVDTGGGALILGTTGANNLNVLRDFSMQGGVFAFSYVTSTASNINIQGNLNVSGGDLVLTQDANVTISVIGNFSFTGGNVIDFSQGLGGGTIRIRGNYTHSGAGSFEKSGGPASLSAIIFNGTAGNTQIVSSAVAPGINIDYTVNSNAIVSIPYNTDLGLDNFLGGTGNFVLGGTLLVGSSDPGGAIQLGTTSGNIRVPDANRTFLSGSTIVYNGTSPQFIGDGFPSSGGDVNLTIDNASGVTLSDDLDIVALRTLLLSNGNLIIGNQTLTINGTVSGSGGITGGPNSNLIIGGNGNFGILTFAGTNQLLNFTINRTSSGLVTLGGNLEILGVFTQTAGNIAIGSNTFIIGGDFARSSGDFLVEGGSSIIVNGSGTLPSEVGMSGTTLGTLTLDRAAANFSTNASLEISNLFLTSGTLNNGTGIGITSGGTITRSAGSMVNSPNNTTNPYNVVYDVGSATVSGPELTGSSTALNNLTKAGTSSLTLNKAITVNGDLTLSNGTFNASTFALILKGDLVSNANGNFETSALAFGGSTTIRGNIAPNFNNFTVNPSSSLNLGAGKTLYVSGNITNNGSIFGSTSTIIFDGNTTLDGGGTSILKGDFNNIQIASTGTFAIACAACSYPTNRYRIDVSGDITVLTGGTFTENQSIVRLVGTTAQSIAMDGENFFDLQLTGTGTVTLTEPLLVSEDLSIAEISTLDTGSGNETITIGDDLTINGTFVPNTGTVVFNGSAGQSIGRTAGTSSIDFYNINISKPTSTTFGFNTPVNVINSIDIDQPGGAYSVDFGGTISAPNVTLLSDVSAGRTGHILAIPDGVTLTGSVRINRYMEPALSQARIYRYISSPIDANPASQLQDDFPITGPFTGASVCAAFRPNARNMYYYNEAVAGPSANGYVGFPTANVSEAMLSGRGYAVQMCDGVSVITWDVSGSIRRAFTGTPVSLPVTYTNNSLPNDDGLNLVGNPFPAPIDWEATGWVKTNITNTFWVRNNKETNIASYNGDLNTGTNGATQYIALGQAFWVQATGGSPVLSITEEVKADQQPEFFRTGPLPDLLRMIVSHDGMSDEIVVHFDDRADDASNTFGDSRKFMSEFLNLYSFADDSVRLAINSLKSLTCSNAVGLGLSDVQPGTYSFSFNGFESFDGAFITLVDHWKGVSKELKPGTTYAFDVTDDVQSFGNTRFQLVFTRGEGVRPVNAEVPPVCDGEGAVLTIHNPQPGVAYYALDASGQVVSNSVTARSDAQLNIDLSLNAGDHQLTVMANRQDCGIVPVTTISSAQILARPSIRNVYEAIVCGTDSTTLVATAGHEAVQYNWYGSKEDLTPLATTGVGEWVTPIIQESRQYFVSSSNILGCEGERVPVNVEVMAVDKPVITIGDGHLITSDQGNLEWYWQGEKIQDGGSSIELSDAGEYTLKSNHGGCVAESSILIDVEQLGNSRVKVSPNPTSDFVTIDMYSPASNVEVSLIRATGQTVSEFNLAKMGVQRFGGKIDLTESDAGLYILRIKEDNQISYKRLIRK